jgi:hypothetical protein
MAIPGQAIIRALESTTMANNNNKNSINNRPLIQDQPQDLFSHQPPSTLLTSVNILIPTKQRRSHIINLPLLQDHSPQLLLFPRSPPPAPRRYSGVMASQPPRRTVQASLSHLHHTGNSAQLSLLPSSVHQTIIAMTPSR